MKKEVITLFLGIIVSNLWWAVAVFCPGHEALLTLIIPAIVFSILTIIFIASEVVQTFTDERNS
jgi:hypothetical protein